MSWLSFECDGLIKPLFDDYVGMRWVLVVGMCVYCAFGGMYGAIRRGQSKTVVFVVSGSAWYQVRYG